MNRGFLIAHGVVFVITVAALFLLANKALTYEACAHVLRCIDAGGERDTCGEQFPKCPVEVPSP